MSFPAIMVLLVAVTGLIWLVDKFIWAPKRDKSEDEPVIVEYARSFFPIILLVLVIRSFIAEPFRIPSSSMLPTLHVGDFILVNKFSYGIRLPVIGTKVLDLGEPERGDVIVFKYPEDPEIDFIKRVVGLPGDTIRYTDKTIFINGEAVEQVKQEKTIDLIGLTASARSELRSEKLGEHEHQLLVEPSHPIFDKEWVVPAEHYFVLGDNRDNSRDSRYWGMVPESNLKGRAFFIWMSWSWDKGGVMWSRIGRSID